MIKHVWFDFDGTISIHSTSFEKIHDKLRYETYANAVGKPVTEQLKREYEKRYEKNGSNSAAFRSLGFPSNYWQKRYETIDDVKFFKAARKAKKTLEKIKKRLPVSLFSNSDAKHVKKILKKIGISPRVFTFILTGEDIKERKPALDGFHKIIKLSRLKPEEILYVGDEIKKDIVPAKKVGMKTCFLYGNTRKADYSFASFEEILTIFH